MNPVPDTRALTVGRWLGKPTGNTRNVANGISIFVQHQGRLPDPVQLLNLLG